MSERKEKYARSVEARVRAVEKRMDKVELRQTDSEMFNRRLEETARLYRRGSQPYFRHRQPVQSAPEQPAGGYFRGELQGVYHPLGIQGSWNVFCKRLQMGKQFKFVFG